MRNLLFVILFVTASGISHAQKSEKYEYTVDLTRVENDRLRVELTPPPISQDEITFYMPKIVPGTYAIADYGRYVNDLKAVDKKGKSLPVEQVNENTWKIRDARKLARLSYWVDDTFDTEVEGPEIFWPAGTNIEDGRNVVINTSGFFGYFEGKKELPFRFNVIRPKNFYGSTGLIPVQTGVMPKSIKLEKTPQPVERTVDVFQTTDYDELIDSPLMYSKPDTAIIRVANTEVLIGSYSPNNKVTAGEIAESIREVLEAQTRFLGGKLPVDKYAFIFYFTDKPALSSGALEHSYSSFYYLPEMGIAELNQTVRDVAAHEFFHIVTPLTIHSEQIENFDYNDPEMSKHLWLYEGVTEYFASQVQVQAGLITPEEYIRVLQEKMITADQFIDTVAFTEISKFTLDKYHDQYYNVYQKGTLIAMCLDLRLLKLSEGKYSLRQLMLDLSKKYGKDKAFRDDQLFDEITKMTYPEIGEFFRRYVAGPEPLPVTDVLKDVGILYAAEDRFTDYSMGISNDNLGLTEVDGKQRLEIATTEGMNAMGKALGFQPGDVLIGINGEKMPDLGPELGQFLQRHFQALPQTDTLSYTVFRRDTSGTGKEVELSAPVRQVELVVKHRLAPDPAATPEQLALREKWLRGSAAATPPVPGKDD